MRTTRRVSTVLVSLFIALFGVAVPASASAEGSFVNRINAERTARGLDPLEVYWDLTDDARAHSNRMMSEDNLHHNPNLGSVTTGWEALGENVGVGPTVDVLHQAFMDSSGHRANILGDWNYVGVGVVAESETKMWVTVVFMRGPEGLNDPDPEPEPEPPAEPAPPPAEPAPPSQPAPAPAPAPSPAPAPAPAASPVVQQQSAEPLPEVVPFDIGRAPGLRPICV